jgi:hypothetical protein
MWEVGIHWVLIAVFLGFIWGREYQRWKTRQAMDEISRTLKSWYAALRKLEERS